MFGVCFSVVHLEHLTLNRMCQANLYKAMEVEETCDDISEPVQGKGQFNNRHAYKLNML